MTIPMLTGKITIDSSNKWLDYDVGSGEVSVSISDAVYDDIYAVASALQTALAAISATVTVQSSHYAKISRSGTLSILWHSGSHADSNIGTLLGYDVSEDDTGAQSYESDYIAQGVWYPNRCAAVDSLHWFPELVCGQRVRTLSGSNTKQVRVGYRHHRDIEFHELVKEVVWAEEATGSYTNRDIETFLKTYSGSAVRYYEDHETIIGGVWCYVDMSDVWSDALNRPHVDIETWNVRMRLHKKET